MMYRNDNDARPSVSEFVEGLVHLEGLEYHNHSGRRPGARSMGLWTISEASLASQESIEVLRNHSSPHSSMMCADKFSQTLHRHDMYLILTNNVLINFKPAKHQCKHKYVCK